MHGPCYMEKTMLSQSNCFSYAGDKLNEALDSGANECLVNLGWN